VRINHSLTLTFSHSLISYILTLLLSLSLIRSFWNECIWFLAFGLSNLNATLSRNRNTPFTSHSTFYQTERSPLKAILQRETFSLFFR
jgi:hypothetical protein